MTAEPLFRETQHMRHAWIWALLGVVSVTVLVIPALLVDSFTFELGSISAVLVILSIGGLLFTIQLITEVRTDGIYVRFAPFHRSFRRVSFDQIENIERTEIGLLTYGGIGIRWTPNTIAYMTTHGSGIKIDRANAKSVVIGSQEPSAVLDTIDELH